MIYSQIICLWAVFCVCLVLVKLYSSETMEIDQMELPRRNRLFAGSSFKFYLTQAKNVGKPSFVAPPSSPHFSENNDFICQWRYSHQCILMQSILRGIPCSISGGFRSEHLVPFNRYMTVLQSLTRLHADSISWVSWILVLVYWALNQFKANGHLPIFA